MYRRSAIILAILAALVLALVASGTDSPARETAGLADSQVAAQLPENRDTELYRAVIKRVQQGEDYYAAVATLHRERSYPLYPFFTVRPPTLAKISVIAGPTGLTVAAWTLLLGCILVWLRALAHTHIGTRAAVAAVIALTGAATINPAGIVMHEFWCGLLLSIALAFSRDGDWPYRLAFAAAALALREFALLFVASIRFLALVHRRWLEFVAAGLIATVFAAFMTAHYLAVVDVRLASDLVSPPWTGMRGPAALAADLSRISWLGLLPFTVAAMLAFLPLAGWLAGPRPCLALIWFGGFTATVILFSRPNNEYWVLALLPAYLGGLGLLGSAARIALGGTVSADKNPRQTSD